MKKVLVTIATVIITTTISFASSIGVIWENNSGMGDTYQKGFDEYIKKTGANLSLDKYNAKGDTDSFNSKIKEFEKSKKVIVVYRSSGLTKAHKISNGKTPIVGGACSHPQALGLMKNPDKPEGNITAVTYFIEPSAQLQVMKKIFPNAKKIGVLYEKGHPAGENVEIPKTKAAAKNMGLEILTAPIYKKDKQPGHKQEAINKTKELLERGAEIIIITNTNSAYTASAEIVETAGSVPVFSFSEKGIKAGALGGLVANIKTLGMILGESVDQLAQGKMISEVPVKTDPKPVFYINTKKMEELKVKIPYAIRKAAKMI